MPDEVQSLRVQNGHISRVVEVGAGINTVSLVNRRTGKEFVPRPTPGEPRAHEFAIRWRGQWIYGNPGPGDPDIVVTHRRQQTETFGSQNLEVFLATADGDLEIRVVYQASADMPAMRKWVTITNCGKEPGLLDRVIWEDLRIAPGSISEMQLTAGLDMHRLDASWHGRPGEGVAMAYDLRSQEGYLALNETPGPAAGLEINPEWRPGLRIELSSAFGGIELKPGESLSTSSATILVYDGRRPEDEATPRLHEYVRQVLASNRSVTPPVVYASPIPLKGAERWLESKITPAHSAGFLVLLLDDRVTRSAGDFDTQVDLFPGGLVSMSNLLDDKDIGLGVSLPLAAVELDSIVAQEHPDWLCRDKKGEPVMWRSSEALNGASQRAMMCLASGYADYLTQNVKATSDDHKLTLLQWTGPAGIAADSSMYPCHAEGHNHGVGDGWLAIGNALIGVIKSISHLCPDLILGLDRNLWGGLADLDPACFQGVDFCRTCWIPSEKGRQTHMEARRIIYRRARLFPPESLAAGALSIDGGNPVAAVATALAGFPLLSGNAERLTSGQIDWLHSILNWHRLLSRRVNFHERFLLLHGDTGVRSRRWDGYAKVNRSGEGFMAVFRNQSPSPSQNFAIQGMDPTARYRLESVVRDRTIGVYSATELSEGVVFATPHIDGADLIEIRRMDV